MGKCSPCENNECHHDNDFEYFCKDPETCPCTCQESKAKSFWKGLGSVALGVGVIAGGVALTVGVGGFSPIAASIAGGVTAGGGASMINNPISKKMFGERMTGKDYFTDVATGSVIGVMTGGIGAAGSVLADVAGGAAKLGCRLGVGAAAGVSSTVFSGVMKRENEVDMKEGAVCGAVAGASSHLSSKVPSKAGKTAIIIGTKVGTKILTSRAKDASTKALKQTNSGVNMKKLAAQATKTLVSTSKEK